MGNHIRALTEGTQIHNNYKMVQMFNHWLSKYYVNTFNWENLPNQIMGLLESKPASTPNTQLNTESSTASREENFKEEVRKSAENFKNLVMRNKVMIFSATYCSYCTVAKVANFVLSVFCSEYSWISALSSKLTKSIRRDRRAR